MHYLVKLFPWLSQLNCLELLECCKTSKAEWAWPWQWWLLQSQKKLHVFTVTPPVLEGPLSPQERYKKYNQITGELPHLITTSGKKEQVSQFPEVQSSVHHGLVPFAPAGT